MPELADALDAAIVAEHGNLLDAEGAAADYDTIWELLGGPRRATPIIAAELMGAGYTRTGAIRTAQRWRSFDPQHRRPETAIRRRPRAGEALERLGRRAVTQQYRQGISRATIVGLVRVSQDLRRRTLTAHNLDPAEVRPFLDAWQAGNLEAAAGRFLAAFSAAYGITSGEPIELEEVELVELEP